MIYDYDRLNNDKRVLSNKKIKRKLCFSTYNIKNGWASSCLIFPTDLLCTYA